MMMISNCAEISDSFKPMSELPVRCPYVQSVTHCPPTGSKKTVDKKDKVCTRDSIMSLDQTLNRKPTPESSLSQRKSIEKDAKFCELSIAFPRNAIDSDFTVDITYFMKSIGLAYDINITLLWHSRGR